MVDATEATQSPWVNAELVGASKTQKAVVSSREFNEVKQALLFQFTNGGHPVIPVRDAGFTALLAKAPGVVEKLDSILVKINQILGEENRQFISDMLEDISSITGALAAKEQVIGELF